MAAAVDIESTRDGDAHVIALAGEIDLATAAPVDEELRRAVEGEGAARIVVDLREVSFLDSTGIHILTKAHARLGERGRELVVRLDPAGHVRRVLDVCGMLEVLTCEDAAPAPA